MRTIERKGMQLAVLGVALVAMMLFGAPRAAQADHDLACLFIYAGTTPPCAAAGGAPSPMCVALGQCPTPSGATAAINICLGASSGDCPVGTPGVGDVSVDDDPPSVSLTAHYGAAGVGVDATTTNFPNPSPTGHLLICVDVPGEGVIEAGIADEFGNCEPPN